MVPAGYLLKHVAPPPAWLTAISPHLKDVCSAAGCINKNAVDLQAAWLHNSFDLANDPDTLTSLARESGVDISSATLFYYTSYELELPSDGWNFDARQWQMRSPVESAQIPDDVEIPVAESVISLVGYDVVVFEYGLGHSPISCNTVSNKMRINEHCLLDTFQEALDAINDGVFGGGCEEGLYTVFSVSRCG